MGFTTAKSFFASHLAYVIAALDAPRTIGSVLGRDQALFGVHTTTDWLSGIILIRVNGRFVGMMGWVVNLDKSWYTHMREGTCKRHWSREVL